MRHQVANAEKMFELGSSLAQTWEGLGMVALVGPMGAGKTHFAKGFAQGLGIDEEVVSPTFSLVREYHNGRFPLFHFDWYRIATANQILELGWDDYEQQGILLVEWADLFPRLWPEKRCLVQIENDGNSRIVTMLHS